MHFVFVVVCFKGIFNVTIAAREYYSYSPSMKTLSDIKLVHGAKKTGGH